MCVYGGPCQGGRVAVGASLIFPSRGTLECRRIKTGRHGCSGAGRRWCGSKPIPATSTDKSRAPASSKHLAVAERHGTGFRNIATVICQPAASGSGCRPPHEHLSVAVYPCICWHRSSRVSFFSFFIFAPFWHRASGPPWRFARAGLVCSMLAICFPATAAAHVTVGSRSGRAPCSLRTRQRHLG